MSEDRTQPIPEDMLLHILARLDSIDAHLTPLKDKLDEFDKAEDEVFRRLLQNA